METRNTDCRDLVMNSEGGIALAELILSIVDTPLPERLNEPGTCEICKAPLPYAWRCVEIANGKVWVFEAGSPAAGKCQRGQFDDEKFIVFPNYYCAHALDRWIVVTDSEPWYGDGGEYWHRGRPTRRNLGWWIKGADRASPVDVAFALRDKRKWEAAADIVESGKPGRKSSAAPMDRMMGTR